MQNSKTVKKLTAGIVTIIILAFCLSLSTFALFYTTVSVQGNVFRTGTIDINLNDSKPVINEHEFNFEPGATIEKTFFIKNDSSWSVYYRLYLDNVDGGLSDVLEVTIKDGDSVLYKGSPKELNKKNIAAADDILKVGERRDLTISFYFPREAGNSAQNLTLSFDICAEAVQTKNNPNKLFD